jgi:homoaconitate hydratase
MGLFNIKLQDDEFYANATEGSRITINKDRKSVQIEGLDKVFYYEQSDIEQTLLRAGGVLPLYKRWGRTAFRQVTMPKTASGNAKKPLNELSNNTDW